MRLHIRANSDSAEDQNLKLKVRDAVLEYGKTAFSDVTSLSDAKKKAILLCDDFQNVAQKTVYENGFNYDVKVKVSKELFSVRTYGNVTLPAGEYNALCMEIGEGKGKNWWCVMFPMLCIPAAKGETDMSDVLTDDELELTKKNPKYDVRFKIAEIYEKITSILK